MDIRIIRLSAEWAESYRSLRLEALANYPENYASSLEEEKPLASGQWKGRLENAWVAGLLYEGQLAGIATLSRAAPYARMKHKGVISGVYIAKAFQGRGLGHRLMEALLAEAAKLYEQIYVSVVSGNIAAVRLYESLGFERYGYEKRAAIQNGAYVDDILMVKFLKLSGKPSSPESSKGKL